ncbi:MAG: ATP phosphoribosyltransferase regulatory subunit [Calditerrivibrio sp.]|nr:ATP phosphoribosyltransferase regulatory subunit [Calditerrivibrio sp.]
MSFSAIDRAKSVNKTINIISEILSLYGYSEIFLPIYEYYDILADKTFNFSDENIIRFIDRNTGKSLVLRPDFTPQVCRVVANYLSDMPLPIRLSYSGRIFRNVSAHKGIKSEKYQVGGEIFGSDEKTGDLEMLLIIKRVMNRLNIKDYKIIIGDKKFLTLLTSYIELDPFLKLLEKKNMTEIEHYLNKLKVDKTIFELLSYLPNAFGGIDVIESIKRLSLFSEPLSCRVDYIINLINSYVSIGGEQDKILFDISETRGLNYYTGINFDVVSDTYGLFLGGGGRYDNLMQKFGYDVPAAGVAFNIEEILEITGLDKYINENIVVVDGSKGLSFAEKLRDESVKVFFK